MKSKVLAIVIAIIMCLCCMTGCQSYTRNYGGSMTLELPPNTKLEVITWKDDSLWYCTRPMREDEQAETHTYQQSSEFGLLEGSVTIIESKK